MYPHSNHIPQPPHSAGLKYKGVKNILHISSMLITSLGLRPRIDHAQVPSPIEAIESDRQTWETKTYMTLPGTHVPLSTSEFSSVDQGNVNKPMFSLRFR